jgi:hypothetical protein
MIECVLIYVVLRCLMYLVTDVMRILGRFPLMIAGLSTLTLPLLIWMY